MIYWFHLLWSCTRRIFDTQSRASITAMLWLILRCTKADLVCLILLKKSICCETTFNLLAWLEAFYSHVDSGRCTTTTAGNTRVASWMLLLTPHISIHPSSKKACIPQGSVDIYLGFNSLQQMPEKRRNDKLPLLYNFYFCIFSFSWLFLSFFFLI